MEGFDVKRYEGGIEDERRLFYVTMTRAREVLCLSHFRRITNYQSPSQFLETIENYAKITSDKNEWRLAITRGEGR